MDIRALLSLIRLSRLLSEIKPTSQKSHPPATRNLPEDCNFSIINTVCNHKHIHNTDARFGWYRYDTRFAIPVYDDAGELVRYNVFKARVLVRHAKDGKLYLYDILRTKKETSKPLEQ